MNEENTILDNEIEPEVEDTELEELESAGVEDELEESEAVEELDELEDEADEEHDNFFLSEDDEDLEEDSVDGEAEELDELENEEETEESEESEEVVEDEEPEPEPAQTPTGLEAYKQMAQEAENSFQNKYGVEFNEFEPGHKEALEDIKVISKKKRAADTEGMNIVHNSGGEKFQKFLREESANMTVRQAQQIADAEARGDFSLSLGFLKKAAEKFNNGDKAREKAEKLNNSARKNKKQKKNPPKTISTGTGTPRSNKISSDMFSLEDIGLD